MNTKSTTVIISIALCLLLFTPYNTASPRKATDKELFQLPIIHLNDFHDRFEETTLHSTPCKPHMTDCIGGFSRLFAAVHKLKKENPNALFLNAGDNFQGTLWYRIFKWNVTQHFLNMLPTDAITLGNHEFDDGIDGVVPYIKAIKAPMVVTNIDSSDEPRMDGLYKNSTIVKRGNKKIGIIGTIPFLQKTYEISSTGKLKFLNESETVRLEADKLKNEEGCDIVIVLSHCGLDVDRIIARLAGPNIDIIVGGHSHTLLYHGDNVPGPDRPADDYPAVVKQDNDHKVLIVQASCFTKYLGFLTVYFNAKNKIVNWEGNPIFLSHDLPQDDKINKLLAPWRNMVNSIGKEKLGETKVRLSNDNCHSGDTNIGNFIADSMVYSWLKTSEKGEWTYAPIGILNCGIIRAGIGLGDILYEDMIFAQPFGNKFNAVELRGDHLLELLEYAAAEQWSYLTTTPTSNFVNMIQVSGLHIVYNSTNPVGERVQEVKVRCRKCDVPSYQSLNLKEYYRVTIVQFMVDGGDGFDMIKNNMRNRRDGRIDIDVLRDYIKEQSPIIQEKDDRIQIVS